MKNYLSFLLIPYLVVLINCDYYLFIECKSFRFTIEENDVAKEFKQKIPFSISMDFLNDDGNVALINEADIFWKTDLSNSNIYSESGFIGCDQNTNMWIIFYPDSLIATIIGKVEEPGKVREFLLTLNKDSIDVKFTDGIEECEEEKEEEQTTNKFNEMTKTNNISYDTEKIDNTDTILNTESIIIPGSEISAKNINNNTIDTNTDTTNFIESSLLNLKSTETYESSIPNISSSE